MPATRPASTKQFVKALLFSKNYHVAKACHQLAFRLSLLNGTRTMILTPGHVGSTTIARSLEAAGMRLHNVHRIQCLHRLTRTPVPPRIDYLEHFLNHELRRQDTSRRWKVVTAVRDPVGRSVGGFFQGLRHEIPNFVKRYEAGTLSVDEVARRYHERTNRGREYILNWFDLEIKPTFGIDVYSQPFDPSRGFAIYHGPIADLLLLRLEDMNAAWDSAVSEFFGIRHCPMRMVNDSSNKPYRALYQAFLDTTPVSPVYADAVYSSRYVRHFYADEEIARFRLKWQRAPAIMATEGTFTRE